MTIYEFMTILYMQTDASAKVMYTLYVPVKIGDDQLYYWGVFYWNCTFALYKQNCLFLQTYFIYFFKSMNWIT